MRIELLASFFVKRVEKQSDNLFTVKYKNLTTNQWKERQFNNYDEARAFYIRKSDKARLYIAAKAKSYIITKTQGRCRK